MKTVAAFTLALLVATSATAAPLTIKAPQTGQTPSYVVKVAGAEAEAIREKYKARFEALKAEMKAEMDALRATKQSAMKQGKGDKGERGEKPAKRPKQS